MKKQYVALFVAVGVLAVTGCASQGTPPSGAGTEATTPAAAAPAFGASPVGLSEQEQMNAALVSSFFSQVFVDGDYTQAADRYLSDDYIQHSPEVAGGVDGFVSGMGGFLDATPELSVSVKRVLAEGDLVLVQSHMVNEPGEDGSAVMDIFRVEGDRIAEHWDAVQAVPADSVNGNTMFDGTTEPTQRSDAEQKAKTAAALDFLDLAFNDADAQGAVDTYIGEPYIQHNPFVADGGDAFVEAFAGAEPLTGDDRTVFPRTITQGDMVAVQTFAPLGDGDAGSGSIDIFRFDDTNKIVEHWDAVQEYPAETASGLTVWDDKR